MAKEERGSKRTKTSKGVDSKGKERCAGFSKFVDEEEGARRMGSILPGKSCSLCIQDRTFTGIKTPRMAAPLVTPI